MRQEIDARDKLLLGHQSLKEFARAHPFKQQRPRFLLKIEVCADLGGGGSLDFG
jgi:hypothetical protein